MERTSRSLLFLIVFIGILTPAMGHQPFFEDKEFTFDSLGHIRDPTISTAMYATLETPTDVDYYDFNGSKGESIFLSITIPQISGQDNFAPTMALIGPGLHNGDLPKNVKKPQIFRRPDPASPCKCHDPSSSPSAAHPIGLAKNKMSHCLQTEDILSQSGMTKDR